MTSKLCHVFAHVLLSACTSVEYWIARTHMTGLNAVKTGVKSLNGYETYCCSCPETGDMIL